MVNFKRFLVRLPFAVSIFFSVHAMASSFARVDADLKTYDDYIAESDAKFAQIPCSVHDREWVKAKLAHMYEIDQYMRHSFEIPFAHQYSNEEKEAFTAEFIPRAEALDTRDTNDLKALLDVYYWFNISSFGATADNQAWIIVQHADLQIDFQRLVLARLEKLYKNGETKPANYAYLFDRIASSSNDTSKRVPQRYGTQGMCVGPGKWLPWPVENERDLDRRRAEVGLGPEADYIAGFKDICH